jgi:hypothetical protein
VTGAEFIAKDLGMKMQFWRFSGGGGGYGGVLAGCVISAVESKDVVTAVSRAASSLKPCTHQESHVAESLLVIELCLTNCMVLLLLLLLQVDRLC